MKMYRSQQGLSTSTSAGNVRRQLSPEMAAAQGTTAPSRQVSRRPAKRNRLSPELPQHTNAPHSTARSVPTSPAKLSKRHVTPSTSDRAITTSEQNRPVLQPVVIPQPSVTPPAPTFSGNFDLYGMYLPFLAKLCLSPGATTPNYSAVYDRILASQAKHDYTARCFLAPPDPSLSAPPHGRFESGSVLDPVAERPFDVTLDCFTYKNALTFTPTERSSFQAPEHSTPGPGIVGHTGLAPACGIKSAKGVFKIKRVWSKEQDGVMKELFEGFFSFSVCYDSMYRKAGHGNGAGYRFAFWGVRAMKDNTGKEIGLGPRKIGMW